MWQTHLEIKVEENEWVRMLSGVNSWHQYVKHNLTCQIEIGACSENKFQLSLSEIIWSLRIHLCNIHIKISCWLFLLFVEWRLFYVDLNAMIYDFYATFSFRSLAPDHTLTNIRWWCQKLNWIRKDGIKLRYQHGKKHALILNKQKLFIVFLKLECRDVGLHEKRVNV